MTVRTAEAVCIGHPDKLCDLIADTILDDVLLFDKSARAAIEAAGSTDSAAVCDALRNLNYDGVSGSINFAGGQDPQREAMIVEFKDGAEVLLGGYSF